MSRLTVVYGGQWGSEGKGQICAAIAERMVGKLYAVRVGGPNAGHTITDATGKVLKIQQIPVAAFVHTPTAAMIGCSGLVILDILERELAWLDQAGMWPVNLPIFVDNNAAIISKRHMEQEAGLKKRISSTGEGVGAATADKVMRIATVASDIAWASGVQVIDTVRGINRASQHPDAHIMLEGTQGHLLSLNTSGYYPYTTSRECGPDAICSQVGISPRAFDEVEVICVLRTFPIRVGGPSGPLPKEITWDDLKNESGGYISTPERTTVTNKIRRIARWNWDLAARVVRETRPTALAISFLDYLFPECAKKCPSAQADEWVTFVEKSLDVPVKWVSTGPGQEFTFQR